MANGTSVGNKAIILAGLTVLLVGVGIIAFMLLGGGEDPGSTASSTPAGGASGEIPPQAGTTGPSGATDVGLPESPLLATPLPPTQLGPLPVLPWQEDGLNELEAQVAGSLAAIEQADPTTAHTLANLPWLADEMLLQDVAAVFLVRELAATDPALALPGSRTARSV